MCVCVCAVLDWMPQQTHERLLIYTYRAREKWRKKTKQRESFANTATEWARMWVSERLLAPKCHEMKLLYWNLYGKRTIYAAFIGFRSLGSPSRSPAVRSHLVRIAFVIPYMSLLSFFVLDLCVARIGSSNMVFAIFGAFSIQWAYVTCEHSTHICGHQTKWDNQTNEPTSQQASKLA